MASYSSVAHAVRGEVVPESLRPPECRVQAQIAPGSLQERQQRLLQGIIEADAMQLRDCEPPVDGIILRLHAGEIGQALMRNGYAFWLSCGA